MSTIIYLFRTYLNYLDNRVWLLLIFSILVAFLDGFGLSMLMPLMESLEMNNDTTEDGVLVRLVRFLGLYGTLNSVLKFMFGIFFVKAIIKFSMGYFQARMLRSLNVRLSTKMYSSIVEVDYSYFSKYNVGHFMAIINVHLPILVNSFSSFISLITSLTMTLTYLVMAGLISWEIAVFSLLMGLLVIGLMQVIVNYVKKLSKVIASIDKENTQIAIQAIYAFKYMASTYSYEKIKNIYKKSIVKITKLSFQQGVASTFSQAFQELATIFLLIALILIQVQALGHPITAVMVVLMLFYRGINQMLSVQRQYQYLVSIVGKIESADAELQSLNKFKENRGLIKLDTNINKKDLIFKNVCYSYQGNKTYAVKNINLTINANKTVALVGPSGSGKSTLVDLLTGLLKPTEGEILFDKTNLNEIDFRSWRPKIGFVNQEITLFDDSLWNNICLYDDKATEEKLVEICKLANIWDFIKETDNGLYTLVGDRGARLSGGQRQRISIARELYKDPDMLILDEATSALDAESESIIKESIEKLKGKLTVVIIAHRLSTIKQADVVYLMEKGEVIGSGSFDELYTKKVQFSKMVELQRL